MPLLKSRNVYSIKEGILQIMWYYYHMINSIDDEGYAKRASIVCGECNIDILLISKRFDTENLLKNLPPRIEETEQDSY